jgi:hypothetical protein
VPRPTSLATVIVPPKPVTMRWQIDSPRPVPTPTGLVVKNGVNSRARTSGGMPVPVSAISTTTCPSGATPVVTVIVCVGVPLGIAWAALTTRLRNTWPSRVSLALDRRRSARSA